MKCNIWRFMMAGLAVVAVLEGRAAGQTPDPESVVKAFYANIAADKNPDAVLDLFLTPDTVVTGISGGAGKDKIYTLTARKFVEAAKAQSPQAHVVDSVTVTTVDGTLASAVVKFHTRDVTCKAVFTLTREGGEWRITSYAAESRLPGEEPAEPPASASGAIPDQ